MAQSPDFAAALALVRQDEAKRVETLARAARSVVCIFDSPAREGGGSGVIIDPAGYGLTNFHVVASLLDSRRGFGGLSDGNLYPLTVIGIDPGGDVAMFRLEGRERFDFAPLGDSDGLRVGQWVAALGNPFLLAEDFAPTITLGVVSGLHRYQFGQGNLLEYADCIQVSTSINPGNSGGPLFDLAGRVVGIVGRASFEERGRVNVGLGYAVSVNQVKRFLPALRAGRLCEHGTLGATVETAGNDLIFAAIEDLSAAERAGVELGDELLAVQGRPVRTPNEYNNQIAVLPAEWPVTLTVRRQGNELTFRPRLERLPLREMPLWIPDLELNHAELRRTFALYEDADRGAQRRRIVRVAARARLVPAGTPDADGVDVAWAVGLGADAGQPWPDAALQREWQDAVSPLLGPRDIDVAWELRGGDDVNGRIVAVVEHRLAGGRRIRWKFDFDSHNLAEITVGDEQKPESAVWTPGERRAFGTLRWPERWQRRTAAGEELELLVTTLDAEFEPPASAPEGHP